MFWVKIIIVVVLVIKALSHTVLMIEMNSDSFGETLGILIGFIVHIAALIVLGFC